MTLDAALLAEVRAARVRMEELEDAAWEARAQLHQAVRRLHHAGGSLREIAVELGMSHQRVHQIVGEDAVVEVEPPPNPPAVVPARLAPADDACSFCLSPRGEVDRMLTGPGGTFVCGGCVVRARQSVEGGLAMAAGVFLLSLVSAGPAPCSFCRNVGPDLSMMVARNDGAVRMCVSCLEACERMLAPAGQYTPKGPAMKRRALVRCTFCNISQKHTRKLIAGPGVYICEVCIAAASAVVTGAPSAPSRSVAVRASSHDCRFCGKARAKVQVVAAASQGRICNECLDLCHDILATESS